MTMTAAAPVPAPDRAPVRDLLAKLAVCVWRPRPREAGEGAAVKVVTVCLEPTSALFVCRRELPCSSHGTPAP